MTDGRPPKWRVTIRTPEREIVRDVFDQYPGGAAATALAGLLALSETRRELGPLLDRFQVETHRL